MFDEKFIEDFMPSLIKLVKKYANNEHDEDELLSDGQMAMLDYLIDTKHCENKNLKKNLYEHLDNKLRKISRYTEENQVDVDVDKLVVIKIVNYDFEDILNIMKTCLTDREFDIVTSYYGIYTYSKTYKELAEIYNVTENRILQIKNKAEMKIRQNCCRNGICLDDLV